MMKCSTWWLPQTQSALNGWLHCRKVRTCVPLRMRQHSVHAARASLDWVGFLPCMVLVSMGEQAFSYCLVPATLWTCLSSLVWVCVSNAERDQHGFTHCGHQFWFVCCDTSYSRQHCLHTWATCWQTPRNASPLWNVGGPLTLSPWPRLSHSACLPFNLHFCDIVVY